MSKRLSKYGVLLINVGTPAAPTIPAIYDYVYALLSDQYIMNLPALLKHTLLRGIAKIRAYQVIEPYKTIWLPQGSPLLIHSQNQAKQLEAALTKKSPSIVVDCAMRYGKPSIESALKKMIQIGITDLVVLTLYPQYTASLTASALDQVSNYLQKCSAIPKIHTLNHFFEQKSYIDALAKSVTDHWHQQGRKEKLIISFHGLPVKLIEKGDPYFKHCCATAHALAKRLCLKNQEWILTFQCKFGLQKWLAPHIKVVLKTLAEKGTQAVDVICPGFLVDCLDTLHEIAKESADLFYKHGGQKFSYIPCLNSTDSAITMLNDLVTELCGFEKNA